MTHQVFPDRAHPCLQFCFSASQIQIQIQNGLFNIAALMLDFNKIRVKKVTKHNSGRQKLKTIYTRPITDRRAFKTTKNTMTVNCNQQKHKSD